MPLTQNYAPEWNSEDDPNRRVVVLTEDGQKEKIVQLNVGDLVVIHVFSDVRSLGEQHETLRVRVIKADPHKKSATVRSLSGGNGEKPVEMKLPWANKPMYIIDIRVSNDAAGRVNRAMQGSGPNPFWPATWVRPDDEDADAWNIRVREVVHGAFGLPVRSTDSAPRAAHDLGQAATDFSRILTDLHDLVGEGERSYGGALARAEAEVDRMAKYYLRLQGKSIDAYMGHPDHDDDRGAAFRHAMEVAYRRPAGDLGEGEGRKKPTK